MTRTWVDQPWLALDTETTGVDVFADRIVEVAAVLVHPDGTVGDTYATIVNPGIEIPTGASDIHGITTARAVEEGIPTAVALLEVAERIFDHGHAPVVMFNARFDWPLMLAEAERHDVDFPVFAPVLDPFLVDRMMDRYRKGNRKLVSVAQHYAVELDEADAHGAVADAVAAARVMRAIVARYPAVGRRTLGSVYIRQVRGHEVWREGFVDYKRRTGDPGFDEPPGWPIPAIARTGAGLPVIDNAPAVVPEPSEVPAEPLGDAGEEVAGTNAPEPAASDPTSDRPAVSVDDVARYATTVFRAAYDAAPKGQKSKVVERLRHALTWAQTARQHTSLNDVTPEQLVGIYQRLHDIAEGAMTYEHDDTSVTFSVVGGSVVQVRFADLAAAEGAAA